MGGCLARPATIGLEVGLGRRARASERVVAGTAGTGGRPFAGSLTRLCAAFFALIELGGLVPRLLAGLAILVPGLLIGLTVRVPGLLVVPGVPGSPLASVSRLGSVCTGL